MKYLLPLLIVALLAAGAQAQNRRDRGTTDRGNGYSGRTPDRSTARPSGPSSASPVSDDNADKSSFDRYRVLFEHNIFMKNRARPTSRPTNDRPREGPRRPEVAFILTGCVIQEDNKFAAFVENAQTGVTLKVAPGDAIATGKVVNIGFDYLEYETGGQLTRVEIGHNFTGSVASLAQIISAGPPTTGPTTGPVDLSNLSMEEKLKRKRLMELNGGK